MIEINKKLYMNEEATYTVSGKVEALNAMLNEIFDTI